MIHARHLFCAAGLPDVTKEPDAGTGRYTSVSGSDFQDRLTVFVLESSLVFIGYDGFIQV